MGPLFSIIVILAIAIPAMLIVYAIAQIALPFREAVSMAVSTTVAAGIGCAFGMLAQAPFYPRTIQSSTALLSYLGISCATGAVAAVLMGRAVWRAVRRKNPN